MSQKIQPTSFRIGIIKDWTSRWFPRKFKFGKMLQEDSIIRDIIEEKISAAGIDLVVIEKTSRSYRITIKASKPGLIIGRGGKGVEDLSSLIENEVNEFRKKNKINEKISINLNIEEIKRYEISANVTAQNIAWDFEKRLPYRRTIKKYLQRIEQSRDIKGAKIMVSGRLDGSEIARDEQLSSGKLPLQTLRADIDYGQATAHTTYGTVGIKVWVYKGELFNKKK